MARKQDAHTGSLITRRKMLQLLGASGAGFLLASCGAAPQAAQPTTAAQPTVAAGQPTTAVATTGDLSEWRLGTVDPGWNGTLRALSWESEGEMRKWQLHIDTFLKSNYPNATPEITWGVPWGEYWTKLQTSITGGDAPDLVWMHDTRVQSFASRDLLLPLDDYIAKSKPVDWPEAFYQSQVNAFQYNGKQYAIPYDWAPGGLYINKTLLEAAGLKPPTEETTLDDIVLMAKELSKPDENIYGLSLPFDWPAGLYWIFRSFGADWFAPDLSKGLLDSPESIAAVQWLADLRFKHQASPRPESIQGADNPFSQGIVAMNWSLNDEAFVIGELIGDKFAWDIAPSPKGPTGRFQFVGGSGWSIPKGAQNADLAYELTRYTLSNKEILPTTAKMGSAFVSRADMWEHALEAADVGFTREAYKHAFYDLGQRDGVVPPYHPKYVEWEALWHKHLDTVFIGEQSDVAAACKALNEDTNRLLGG